MSKFTGERDSKHFFNSNQTIGRDARGLADSGQRQHIPALFLFLITQITKPFVAVSSRLRALFISEPINARRVYEAMAKYYDSKLEISCLDLNLIWRRNSAERKASQEKYVCVADLEAGQ